MQSVFPHASKLRLSAIALACQMACFGMSSAYAETAPATDATTPAQAAPSVPTAPGTPAATGSALPTTNAATVTVTGKKVGMGLMVQEDAPKARSTVTAEELAKQRTTGNVYDALALMPSVNTYSYDGTGLFGGGLTLRGFNSDQVGVTINGVPVNDSGSFTVFPQEYVDAENTCSEYVTQGSTDVDSPQVGATGGNIGITTCDPEDVQRFRFAQTLGQLNLAKTYLRYDTGRFAHDYAKFFVSYSHAEADKWKGFGGAKRDHVDMGFNWDWDKFNYIHGTILFNSAVNNNINSISLADLKANGYYYDYSGTFQGHAAPSPGKAVTDPAPSASGNSYYALSLNPFEDVIASATAKFRLNDSTDIKIVPYYWYGYGTGGVEQKQLSESGFLNSATGKVTSGVDLNGDGDTLDKVTVYSGSVTRTQRPGVTASVTENIGDHQILGGIWYERATHRQTGPAELVDGSGGGENVWLQGQQIFRPDGTPYESRNWTTISTAYQAYLQDTISLMDNKLLVNVGVRDPHVKRDFTNFANETTPLTYRMVKTYDDLLPQFGVRYRITNDDQLFASYAKNFRAPPNFVYAATSGDNVVITNGVAKLVTDVQPETSWDLDVGYRHQGTLLTTSATMFFTNFKNRQANATDPNTQISTYTNVGNVKNKGFELEAGNTPINGWTVYGSLGYLNTRVQSNLAEGVGTNGQPLFLPTAGNQFPLSPKWKAAISTSYETDAWYARVSAKMTSTQQATLVNDELVPGYTTLNLDAGYQFPSFGAFKNPKLTLNVTNLLSHQYRDPSGQITNENAVVTPNGTVAKGGTVFYYLGAPRLISMNLRMDF